MEQGVEIFVDGQWLFVGAVDGAHADALQAEAEKLTDVPVYSRRVARTPEGQIVTISATE